MEPTPKAASCMLVFTKVFVIAMCLGFVAAGVVAMRSGWEQWQLNRESAGWPETTGTVRRAWVDVITVKTGNRTAEPYRDTMYVVKIDYTAKIEGQEIAKTSDSPLQAPEAEKTREGAEKVAANFTAGNPIAVYYKPGDLETVRLERIEVASAVWIVLGLGGGLASLVLGLWGGWWTAFRLGPRHFGG